MASPTVLAVGLQMASPTTKGDPDATSAMRKGKGDWTNLQQVGFSQLDTLNQNPNNVES